MIDLKKIRKRIKKLTGSNRFKAAIGFTGKMLDLHPGEGFLYKILGDLYLKTGDITRSFQEYERGLFVYWGQGYYPNAIMLLKKVMCINPEYPDAYRVLSRIQIDLGQYLLAARNQVRYILRSRCAIEDICRHLEIVDELILKSKSKEKKDENEKEK